MQKRCLTFQDYSCLGRCSLTVALPVISAAGIETCGVPTAILSNHTAGFKDWTFRDLTDDLRDVVDHWRAYKHDFDAIYTGYLTTKQVPIIRDIIKDLRMDKTLVVVDPSFADHGELYPGYTSEHVETMKTLVADSDVLLPNMSEACFLLGEKLPESYDQKFVHELLTKLVKMGPSKVLISSVSYEKGMIGCEYYDEETDSFGEYMTESYPGSYHGTGDLFSSAFVAAMLNDFSFAESCEIAHDFVHFSIAKTIEEGGSPEIYYGVEFEKLLPYLIRRLNLN